MPIVNQGKDVTADAVSGGSTYSKYNAANTHIIVGNSTSVFNVANTQASFGAGGNGTSSFVKAVSSVNRTGNVVAYVATFAPGEASFAWEEWGLLNAASSGQLLNRKVESLGTKTGSQQWTFTVNLTFGS